MLRFKNDVINVENNGKVFVENFDKAFKSESFPLTLRVLHKIKGIIKLHNTVSFLKTTIFGSHLRDLQNVSLQSF